MYLPKLSVQAQKFGILIKKRLHWASVVRGTDHDGQRYQFQAKQGTIEIYQLRSAQKTHH